jgi:Asp-tRNA(Asn)/Glu-tRNA(Gln) amidotransferase B subunit
VLDEMLASGAAPADIVAARGLEQVDDAAALTALVGQVLAENADAVARYREGKTNLMGFFVGQVMKASGGKAKPATVRSLLEQALQAV